MKEQFTLGQVSDRTSVLMNLAAEESVRKQYTHLEVLARAFLEETGLPPSEVELVQQTLSDKVVWYFRKKGSDT